MNMYLITEVTKESQVVDGSSAAQALRHYIPLNDSQIIQKESSKKAIVLDRLNDHVVAESEFIYPL